MGKKTILGKDDAVAAHSRIEANGPPHASRDRIGYGTR